MGIEAARQASEGGSLSGPNGLNGLPLWRHSSTHSMNSRSSCSVHPVMRSGSTENRGQAMAMNYGFCTSGGMAG